MICGILEARQVITTVTLCSIRQLHAGSRGQVDLAFLTGPRSCSSFVLIRGILLTILQPEIGTLTTEVSASGCIGKVPVNVKWGW